MKYHEVYHICEQICVKGNGRAFWLIEGLWSYSKQLANNEFNQVTHVSFLLPLVSLLNCNTKNFSMWYLGILCRLNVCAK